MEAEIDNRINELEVHLTHWINLPDDPSTIDVRINAIFEIRYELDKLLSLKKNFELKKEFEGRMEVSEKDRKESNLKNYGGRRRKKRTKRRKSRRRKRTRKRRKSRRRKRTRKRR